MTKKLLLTFALIALLCPLNAGELEDGLKAYENKGYITPLQELKSSAEEGRTDAQYRLGKMYYSGKGFKGIKKDYKEAAKWLSLAVLYHPYDAPDSPAVQLLKLIAEENVADAQYGLGNMYYDQHVYSEDPGLRWTELRQATNWYKLAAKQAHAGAQYKLGHIYLYSGFFLHSEYDESRESRDYIEALKWFSLAVKQEHIRAQYQLGNMYRYGKGVSLDYRKAIKWYTLAAEQGDKGAQDELGEIYYHGYGVKKDYKEALKWLTLAAKQGRAMAQYLLGIMYYQGQEVKQDYDEAFRLTKLSAEHKFGSGRAQFNLGALHYYVGRGVAKDIIRAYMWITLSFDNVSYEKLTYRETREKIQNMKKQLSKELTPEQIKEAEQLAKTCKENDYKNC